MIDYNIYRPQLINIVESGAAFISDIKPSAWTEGNVIMPNKPFPGPFKYSRTPYTREIIDCLAPDHPARWVAVMKGGQIGFSAGVIYPGAGYIMKNAPGNTAISVGAPDLIEKAMEKLDILIDNAGLRQYIKPQSQRKRNNKSGDTNFKKDFPNGYVMVFHAGNHKAIRQMDLMYGFFDDFEAIKLASKESGNTRKLLEQRFAAYADSHKIFMISTPEQKETSNIEPAYLLGDQRKFLIPCECCKKYIEIKWTVDIDGKETAGINYRLDEYNKLVPGSVGYICQLCGNFFTDRNKMDWLNEGYWHPTADPSRIGYYSYHISSLYAPVGMYDWEHYVRNYLEACPPGGQSRSEALYKTFVNMALGETYETPAESPKANQIMKNIRAYEVLSIPEKLSIEDGNGNIVLLTCAADLNGTEQDARLDYEIVAWAENGASYSIKHGSIGTFVPREGTKKNRADREKWTYEEHKSNSVWPELDKILEDKYTTDTGRTMGIFVSGVDCGHYTTHAYNYLDKTNHNVLGLRGDKENKYLPYDRNVALFKAGRERAGYYLLEVGKFKDILSDYMKLNWEQGKENQPSGFMNFPQPSNGLYQFSNYFEHFESEHRVVEANKDLTSVSARWVKKNSSVQNHMFDCRVYNMALKELFVYLLGKELKIKDFGWKDFVTMVLGESD